MNDLAYRSAADIAVTIRAEIENGTFRRFERLPASRQMAEDLGVARNTLRDALYQLEKEGLLETRPGSGTYVTATPSTPLPVAIEGATPLELIDARFALEPHICRLCVLHGRREDFDLMGALCQKMEEAGQDGAAFAEADAAFHSALADTTRNNLLIWLIGQINMVRSLDEWDRMRQLTVDVSTMQRYNLQHRSILNALRSREPERAASEMKEHLELARLSLTRAAAT